MKITMATRIMPCAWNGVKGKGLTDSLKIRGETTEAKKKMREDRRRKADEELEDGEISRKRQKHYVNYELEEGEIEEEIQSHKRMYEPEEGEIELEEGEIRQATSKNYCDNDDGQVKWESESPWLEGSTLTEELGQPEIRNSIYDSSADSKDIRMKKLNWSELAGDYSEERACATSGESRTEIIRREKAELAVESSYSRKKRELNWTEAKYRELFSNWVPIPIQSEPLKPDWLFETTVKTRPRNDKTRPSNARNDKMSCLSSSWCPTAQYLPEVDIYALQYAIPF